MGRGAKTEVNAILLITLTWPITVRGGASMIAVALLGESRFGTRLLLHTIVEVTRDSAANTGLRYERLV